MRLARMHLAPAFAALVIPAILHDGSRRPSTASTLAWHMAVRRRQPPGKASPEPEPGRAPVLVASSAQCLPPRFRWRMPWPWAFPGRSSHGPAGLLLSPRFRQGPAAVRGRDCRYGGAGGSPRTPGEEVDDKEAEFRAAHPRRSHRGGIQPGPAHWLVVAFP